MLPNFLLIGEPKAGTTSLHGYLGQHPDIFMSRLKEPGYFAFAGTDGYFPKFQDRPFVSDLADYEALFRDAEGHRIVGESSPQYLEFATPDLIDRIGKTLPDVKLLAVLRQPVDQAYSRYIMLVRSGLLPETDFRRKFLSDLADFDAVEPFTNGERTVTKSYATRLKLFRDAFGAEQLKIMLFDDLVAQKEAFLREILAYLAVDPAFEPDARIHANEGGLFRSRTVAAIFNRPNPVRWLARRLVPPDLRSELRQSAFGRLSRPAPPLSPAVRAELTGLLADEISALEALTGHDLARWRA